MPWAPGGIAFLVISAAAPLTVMAGVAPVAINVGGIGAPALPPGRHRAHSLRHRLHGHDPAREGRRRLLHVHFPGTWARPPVSPQPSWRSSPTTACRSASTDCSRVQTHGMLKVVFGLEVPWPAIALAAVAVVCRSRLPGDRRRRQGARCSAHRQTGDPGPDGGGHPRQRRGARHQRELLRARSTPSAPASWLSSASASPPSWVLSPPCCTARRLATRTDRSRGPPLSPSAFMSVFYAFIVWAVVRPTARTMQWKRRRAGRRDVLQLPSTTTSALGRGGRCTC